MKKANTKAARVVTLGLTLALSLSTLALAGCDDVASDDSGSSDYATSAYADDSSSSGVTPLAAAEDSSSSLTLDDVEARMTEGYMGQNEDSGEYYYWAANDDGSLAMLAILNTSQGDDNARSASYVGQATANGNNVVVTDYVTGNVIGFDVTQNDDGTITLDLGEKYGKATLGSCDVSDVFDAFKKIDKYTTAVK